MLYKHRCSVHPRLYSETFGYFEQAFDRFRILDKWFYFYMNEPVNPVIVWKSQDTNHYQLQPGTNRYIGVALRGNNDTINGLIISDCPKEAYHAPEEIQIFDIVDSTNLDLDDYSTIDLKHASHQWGVADHTLYRDNSWYDPVWDWIYKNLKHSWGLEYNNKIYYVNSNKHFQKDKIIENFRSIHARFKKTNTIIKASDFPNVQAAVQHLFGLIKKTEFCLTRIPNKCIINL